MDEESVALRVLRERQKAQESRACYPCRQRKVKCDKGKPCRTCQRRGHPEICTFPSTEPAGHTRRSRSQHDTTVGPGLETSDRHDRRDSRRHIGPIAATPLGGDSAATILSLHASSPGDAPPARDVRDLLGLRNTFTRYPFMETSNHDDVADTLVSIAPRQADVVKLYQLYRVHVAPFNPVLLDPERFELDLAAYLKAEVAGDLRGREKLVAGQWSSRKNISFIALLLAVLASGAHFADEQDSTASTRAFAKQCAQALRLANFMFQPSAVDIQTLLVLGKTLQDTGQADAAWSILGTTVRLAQTLDLHPPYSSSSTSEGAEAQTRLLREKVMFQDALLCICHDRAPAIYRQEWLSESRETGAENLSYGQLMARLSSISLDFMQRKALGLWEGRLPVDALHATEELYAMGSAHLQDASACENLPQLLEHYALRMHVSFTITFICRSIIRNSVMATSSNSSGDAFSDDTKVRARARLGLIAVCEAFLEFQALSVVPRRTWSMLHEALSAALLLHAWDMTRDDPECRRLQQRVVDVFTTAGTSSDTTVGGSDDGADGGADDAWRLLSPQHIRTLLALREVLGSSLTAEQQQPEPTGSPTGSTANNGPVVEAPARSDVPIDGQDALLNPLLDFFSDDIVLDRLSPVDYLNYYMNGPAAPFFSDDDAVQFP